VTSAACWVDIALHHSDVSVTHVQHVEKHPSSLASPSPHPHARPQRWRGRMGKRATGRDPATKMKQRVRAESRRQ
jgi:hypothetical protein